MRSSFRVSQFGVRQTDDDLLYMRNRFYAPSLGRFMTEDPIGLAGGDVGLYRYVQNDPVNFVDPTGKFFISGSVLVAYVYGPTIMAVVRQNAYAINEVALYALNAIAPGPSNSLGAILQIGPDNINRAILQGLNGAGYYIISTADYLIRQFPHDAINFTDDVLTALSKEAVIYWGFNQPNPTENTSNLILVAGNGCD
jgi:RHS repeat-associated protein